jgi:EF-P beta-lysylation protein EpmB
MITHKIIPLQTRNAQAASWQDELARAIRDPEELFNVLELDKALLPKAVLSHGAFKLLIPHPYLTKIQKGNINDPLLAQVLPLGAELNEVSGFSADPLAELSAQPVPGLIHKYRGRALMMISPACAIHCRYCFRRHFPYQGIRSGRQQWLEVLQYINDDEDISEVIFSGGDPLLANDQQLAWLTEQIASITHVKRLRVHTRLPVVIPSRITPKCLDWLSKTRLNTNLVLHINHPNELGDDVRQAVALLKRAGIDVMNQSVLLKGVNDNADTLVTLSESLYDSGILPYYLHMLDTVQGAAHFKVDRRTTMALQEQMLARLPGYLVPRFVIEIPGSKSKSSV